MHPLSDVLPMDLDAERALIGAVIERCCRL
jgi:hypothetical protein